MCQSLNSAFPIHPMLIPTVGEIFLNVYGEEAKRLSSGHLVVIILLLTSVCM